MAGTNTPAAAIEQIFSRLPLLSSLQRLLLILVAALILPIVAVLTLLLVQSLSDDSRAVEVNRPGFAGGRLV